MLRAVGSPRMRRVGRVAARLIGWQAVTQFAGLITGLLLLRWLSINQYASTRCI